MSGFEDFVLNKFKIGLAARVFARDKKYVAGRVKILREMVNKMSSITLFGKPLVDRIDFWVWDPSEDYQETGDCGETFQALKNEFSDDPFVYIHCFQEGELFVDILNAAVQKHQQMGCTHSLIVSPEIHSYMTEAVFEMLYLSLYQGSMASGVTIHPHAQLVQEGGFLNTFMVWEIAALLAVGGFPQEAAMGKKGQAKMVEKDGLLRSYAGCEEAVPLAEMLKNFPDRDMAAIDVEGAEGLEYLKADDGNKELMRRNAEKIRDMRWKKYFHLRNRGVNPSVLASRTLVYKVR